MRANFGIGTLVRPLLDHKQTSGPGHRFCRENQKTLLARLNQPLSSAVNGFTAGLVVGLRCWN